MALYGVYDVATGALVGVSPVNGVLSPIAAQPVSISGNPTVGNTLTAVLGIGWTATGYQWTRDGANISGATSSTYTLTSPDATHSIGCSVTGLASKSSFLIS